MIIISKTFHALYCSYYHLWLFSILLSSLPPLYFTYCLQIVFIPALLPQNRNAFVTPSATPKAGTASTQPPSSPARHASPSVREALPSSAGDASPIFGLNGQGLLKPNRNSRCNNRYRNCNTNGNSGNNDGFLSNSFHGIYGKVKMRCSRRVWGPWGKEGAVRRGWAYKTKDSLNSYS